METTITREVLSADVIFLCQCIRDCAAEGLSTHMIDMRNALGAAVTLGFSDYLRFLRHFGYVKLGDDHVLSLASTGKKLADEERAADLDHQLNAFFADRLSEGVVSLQTEDEERAEIESIGAEVSIPPPSASGEWKRQTIPPPSASGEWKRQTPSPVVSGEWKRQTGPLEKSPVEVTRPASSSAPTPPPGEPPVAPSAPMRYMLGEPLGRGPRGRVLKARHTTLTTEVAIKEISDPGTETTGSLFPARVKREVALQARIRHPAVLAIYDLDLTANPVRIVEELCEGGNLRTWLTTTRPTPPKILRAFTQLLDGLAATDAEGFSHGNIKAENLLFDRFGNAKLSDFGLGRIVATTPDHGVRGDLYALGALLYAALTGVRHGPAAPFPSKIVPSLPAAMNWVIEKMTAEDPAERYADPAQARDAMLGALADPSYGAPGVMPVLTGFAPSEG